MGQGNGTPGVSAASACHVQPSSLTAAGALVPLLLAVLAINFMVHVWLLFGKPALLHDDHAPLDPPVITAYTATCCSCLLQLSLLFVGSSSFAWV